MRRKARTHLRRAERLRGRPRLDRRNRRSARGSSSCSCLEGPRRSPPGSAGCSGSSPRRSNSPPTVQTNRRTHVDPIDDRDAMDMAVEHRLEDLKQGVVRNSVGQRRLVRVELLYHHHHHSGGFYLGILGLCSLNSGETSQTRSECRCAAHLAEPASNLYTRRQIPRPEALGDSGRLTNRCW